jgi:positive regulator of sigma E activity
MSNENKIGMLRLTFLALSLAAGAAAAKSTPYASASSCKSDAGCGGGTIKCATLANGVTCYCGATGSSCD